MYFDFIDFSFLPCTGNPLDATLSLPIDNVAKLKIFYCNARSVIPKIHYLRNYISLYKPSVIAITETWLNSSIPSSFLDLPNYVAYRKDRDYAKGGGSLILVSQDIFSKPVTLPAVSIPCCKIDAVACEIPLLNDKSIGLLCIYRPPSLSINDNPPMYDMITSFLDCNFSSYIVVGDFNFPDIIWPTSSSSSQSQMFLNFLEENFLRQHINSATRKASDSILDLVLTSPGTDIEDLSINEGLANSDHSIIQFSVNIQPIHTKRKVKRRNFKNADWSLFRQLLSSSYIPTQIATSDNVDLAWDQFISTINSALDKVAPYNIVSRRNFVSSSKVRTALRRKRRLFKKFIEERSVQSLVAYAKSAAIVESATMSDVNQREAVIVNSKNPKAFWSYVNRRLCKQTSVKHVYANDSEVTDPERIANIFNNYFASIFASPLTPTNCSPQPTPRSESRPTLQSIVITFKDVYDTLKAIPAKTSTDPDNLSYKILKEGGAPLIAYLVELFSLSLDSGLLPSAWKIASVTPIFKGGSKTSISNYRPISVTSCCSRVLERIVRNKLTDFISTYNKISDTQHGFQSGKSTDTILLKFYDYITAELDSSFIVDAVFLILLRPSTKFLTIYLSAVSSPMVLKAGC